MKHTPDNDDEPFQPLGLHALRLLVKLDEQKKKNEGQESSSGADDKQRALDQDEFVRRGMERIRRFEERAAGVDASGRKRRV